jgi:hypothetical protein
MPRTAKVVEADEAETNGKRPYVPRLSLTMTTEALKNIRIAAALADMDKGEWCTAILEKAAEKALEGVT